VFHHCRKFHKASSNSPMRCRICPAV
jgi:hypothetical protein